MVDAYRKEEGFDLCMVHGAVRASGGECVVASILNRSDDHAPEGCVFIRASVGTVRRDDKGDE